MKLKTKDIIIIVLSLVIVTILVFILFNFNDKGPATNYSEPQQEDNNDKDNNEKGNDNKDNNNENDIKVDLDYEALESLTEIDNDINIEDDVDLEELVLLEEHGGLEPIIVSSDDILSSNLNFSDFKDQIEDYKQLLVFLNNDFEYIKSSSLVAKGPEAFYETKRGSAIDFAVFSFAVLDEMRYNPGIMRYDYINNDNEKESNFVLVFRAEEGPRHIVFNEDGVFLFEHGWSFKDLINTEEKRLAIDIDRYLYFVDLTYDLSEPGSIDWVINK